MSAGPDLAALGREIVDSNLYMVLATADPEGRPWASPVYFAHDSYRHFVWVSRPGARHSQNIAARPEIAIAVFDSGVPINTGKGVYVSATAEEIGGPKAEPALELFSRRSVGHGGGAFAPEDVRAPARLRLYRAIAAEQFVLDANDQRIAVAL